MRGLDDSTTGNKSIFDYSDDTTLDEVSIRLSCRFLNIIAVNNLPQYKRTLFKSPIFQESKKSLC